MTFDSVLAWIGTPLLAAVVAFAAVATDADTTPRGRAFVPWPGDAQPVATPAVASPDESVGGNGEKVRIDPQTLRLVGTALTPEPGSQLLDWDVLASYVYQPGLEGLPEDLETLDGASVTVAGFLLPLYEFDDIREFNLVASHWSCCFGVPPGLNGWIQVKLADGEVGLPNTSEPLKVSGTFRVREHKEAGYVVSIFSIDDAKAEVIGW